MRSRSARRCAALQLWLAAPHNMRLPMQRPSVHELWRLARRSPAERSRTPRLPSAVRASRTGSRLPPARPPSSGHSGDERKSARWQRSAIWHPRQGARASRPRPSGGRRRNSISRSNSCASGSCFASTMDMRPARRHGVSAFRRQNKWVCVAPAPLQKTRAQAPLPAWLPRRPAASRCCWSGAPRLASGWAGASPLWGEWPRTSDRGVRRDRLPLLRRLPWPRPWLWPQPPPRCLPQPPRRLSTPLRHFDCSKSCATLTGRVWT
mmetsp:Transcript_28010/g.90449  ORF Transcript_28010/g.90449 Transcript_28010/m.90449 type:complete len:264 (+) Transcript_28010:136-927(+)